MRVDLSIDELVLVGFDPLDRHRIADAMERELAARLTAEQAFALATAGGSLDRIRAADVRVTSGAGLGAAAIWNGIGRSVADAIGGPGRRGGEGSA
jgi:hypothetical protein